MSKPTKITKKLVDNNSQLAELLAERNIQIGDEVEKDLLDELYSVLKTTELVELTQEHFDKEPALTEKGFKVGDKVRVARQSILEGESEQSELQNQQGPELDTQSQDQTESNISNKDNAPKYVVASPFRDINDESKIYEIGEDIPSDFEEERIQDLLNRKLIHLA